ncbi:MAG: peptidylprolyl isomerase [Microthrixaceae bacterium]
MRRVRSSVLLAGSLAGALLLSGCGVLADTNAATVGDQEISVDTVDELARDGEFMSQIGGSAADDSESVLDGQTARTALAFEIQRAAWMAEAERLGVSIDGARADAQQQIASAGMDGLSEDARDTIIDFLAAQQAVMEHYAQLDPGSEQDLRTLYDAAPKGWDRTCFSAVAAPGTEEAAVQSALDEGTDLADIAASIDRAEFLESGPENCVPEELLPRELAQPLAATPVGDTTAAIVVVRQTGPVVYAFQVEERGRRTFDEARPELEQTLRAFAGSGEAVQQAVGTWTLLLALNADVNPRYGSEVTGGGIGVEVLPPVTPLQPAGERAALVPALDGGADAAP